MKLSLLFYCLTLTISSLAQAPGNVKSNLDLWLKANKGVYRINSNLTNHNDTISLWQDQSLNNNNAVQNGAYLKPKFKNDSLNNLNFNPYIFFDNVNILGKNYLTMNQSSLPIGNTSRTVFIVAQPTGTPDKVSLLFFGDQESINSGDYVSMHLSQSSYRLHFGNSKLSNTLNNSEPAVYVYKLPNKTNPITNDFIMKKNGKKLFSTPSNNRQIVSTDDHFAVLGAGRVKNTSSIPERYWNGKVSELCVYNDELSKLNTLKIESYLALKNGISLDTSYFNNQGNITWNYNSFTEYNNDIIGIAREDSSDFLQKQSKAFDNSHTIFISNKENLNIQNTGNILQNNSYAIIGHNDNDVCPTINSNNEIPVTSQITERIAKEFKITKTNFNQNFNLAFDICNSFAGTTPNKLKLLIDFDGDFTNAMEYNNGDLGIDISIVNGKCIIKNIPTSIIANDSISFLTIGRITNQFALPIELVKFDANKINENVLLSWSTVTEINNDFFTIERSIDAINWTQIAIVNGSGNSNTIKNYDFVDEKVPQSILYYKLKQTDFDGQYSYSEIKIVLEEKKIKSALNISIYPNPCKEWIHLDFKDDKIYNIDIYSASGRKYISIKNIKKQLKLNLKNFSKGLYMIHVFSEDQNTIYKIIKQ